MRSEVKAISYKKCLDSFNSVAFVEGSYFNADVCKFESVQSEEIRDQSTDFSKGCSRFGDLNFLICHATSGSCAIVYEYGLGWHHAAQTIRITLQKHEGQAMHRSTRSNVFSSTLLILGHARNFTCSISQNVDGHENSVEIEERKNESRTMQKWGTRLFGLAVSV